MSKPVLMTAVHDGEKKSLSMNAWSRLLGVTEYYVRNAKYRDNKTDQEIIDCAIAESKGAASTEELRRNFLFKGARQ